MTTSHGKVIKLSTWQDRTGLKLDMMAGWVVIALLDALGWLLFISVVVALGKLAKAVL